MADILLTNDDGFESIGFYPLYRELAKDFEVVAIAPDKQKSWQGKSITKKKSLTLKKKKLSNLEVYVLDGTPADCVQVGLYELALERPKLIVSGINIGSNLGCGKVLSSGTAGAGMEAAIDGIRAIASSLHLTEEDDREINYFHRDYYYIYDNAAKITAKIVKAIIDQELESDVDLLAINIPKKATMESDFLITSLYRERYGQLFFREGNKFIHKNPPMKLDQAAEGTDFYAINHNKISVTPISIDLTSRSSKEKLDQVIRSKW